MSLYKKALNVIYEFHKDQKRHDGSPYIGHLLTVSSLVMQYGHGIRGVDICSITALLHDIIEDTSYTEDSLYEDFGYTITRMVMCLSEDTNIKDWKLRKEGYFLNLQSSYLLCRELGMETNLVALVCLADKVHNLSCHLDTKVLGKVNKNYYRDVWFYIRIKDILKDYFNEDFLLYVKYLDLLKEYSEYKSI